MQGETRVSGINWEAVDEHLRLIRERMARNVKETGHPFHHRTRSGVIVDSDSHLNRDYLEEYYWLAGISIGIPKSWKRPKTAVKAVLDWYDTKAGKRWLKAHSTAQIVEAAPLQPQQAALW